MNRTRRRNHADFTRPDLDLFRSLSEAREYNSPDLWGPQGIEDELRLTSGELVVCGNSMWFTAQPKHAGFAVQTRAVTIESVVDGVLRGDSPLFLCDDPAALAARVSSTETPAKAA